MGGGCVRKPSFESDNVQDLATKIRDCTWISLLCTHAHMHEALLITVLILGTPKQNIIFRRCLAKFRSYVAYDITIFGK